MLECKYINSIGEEFVFNVDNNRINKSDVRDYEWNYIEQYEKIKLFTKDLSTRTIPVFFFNRSQYMYHNELYYKAEDLYEIIDRDVRTLKQGKLYVGDYFVNCYVVGSSKAEYDNGVIISENLIILSDWNWRKDITRLFGGSSAFQPTSQERDFPYDYRWDYVLGASQQRFVTDAIAPFDFKIAFQGPVENPTLVVQNQIYRVYTTVEEGEYLTVDSVEKTIIKTKQNGDTVNEFNYRDRENYIFEKMPVRNGSSLVIWQEGKLVTVTAYLERSEPKWI